MDAQAKKAKIHQILSALRYEIDEIEDKMLDDKPYDHEYSEVLHRVRQLGRLSNLDPDK